MKNSEATIVGILMEINTGWEVLKNARQKLPGFRDV
jgi:hypothetical protein